MNTDIAVESDTYAPSLSDTGKYEDCMPRFGAGVTGYYCSCGARKDKLYTTSSVLNTHMKTKTHQKWLEVLNLNRTNHFTENIKMQETIASQRLIIAKLEKTICARETALASKDNTIDYLTKQLGYYTTSKTVTNLLD